MWLMFHIIDPTAQPEPALMAEWGEFLAAVDWVTLAECFVSNMRCKLGGTCESV